MSAPRCYNCKHFYAGDMIPLPYCMHPGNAELVQAFNLAKVERTTNGNCGLTGKLFEQAPPKLKLKYWLFGPLVEAA